MNNPLKSRLLKDLQDSNVRTLEDKNTELFDAVDDMLSYAEWAEFVFDDELDENDQLKSKLQKIVLAITDLREECKKR